MACGKFALELLEGEGLEVVELLENIGDGRRSVGIYAEFFPLVILRASRFFLREDEGPAKEGKDQSIYNKSKPGRDGSFHSLLNRAMAGSCLHSEASDVA